MLPLAGASLPKLVVSLLMPTLVTGNPPSRVVATLLSAQHQRRTKSRSSRNSGTPWKAVSNSLDSKYKLHLELLTFFHEIFLSEYISFSILLRILFSFSTGVRGHHLPSVQSGFNSTTTTLFLPYFIFNVLLSYILDNERGR